MPAHAPASRHVFADLAQPAAVAARTPDVQGASHCSRSQFGSAPARSSSRKNGFLQGVVLPSRRKVDDRSFIGHETISPQRALDLADALWSLRGPAQRLDMSYLPILHIEAIARRPRRYWPKSVGVVREIYMGRDLYAGLQIVLSVRRDDAHGAVVSDLQHADVRVLAEGSILARSSAGRCRARRQLLLHRRRRTWRQLLLHRRRRTWRQLLLHRRRRTWR